MEGEKTKLLPKLGVGTISIVPFMEELILP